MDLLLTYAGAALLIFCLWRFGKGLWTLKAKAEDEQGKRSRTSQAGWF